MAEKTNLDLFIQKALKKQENKKMSFDIEVQGFGLVTFQRPTNDRVINYFDLVGKATIKEENGDVKQDFLLIVEASSELVYTSCAYLQSKELRETLNILDPLKSPIEIFGINETIIIANKIIEAFEGEKVVEEVQEKVKN